MNINRSLLIILLISAFMATGMAIGISPAGAETKCSMSFTLRGWSAIYETAKGTATITCDNGQSASAVLDMKGGGITVGKSTIKGTGTFTGVSDISEVFGPYAKAEAHAGVVKSAGAQVLTKGEVSLALAGTGKGVDLGISFGRLSIRPAGGKGSR
jgi:hypothetical protein